MNFSYKNNSIKVFDGSNELAQGLKELINLNSLNINLEQKEILCYCIINKEREKKTKKFLTESFAKKILLITKIQR